MTEVDIEKENAAIAKEYKELLKVSYRTLSKEDKKLIRSAFDVAVDVNKINNPSHEENIITNMVINEIIEMISLL